MSGATSISSAACSGFVYDRQVSIRIAIAISFVVLSACKKDPPVHPDAAMNEVDAPPGLCGNGSKGYLEACTDTAECDTCECRLFGHSQVCTKTCTGDTECPAPSGGCSQGYCRP
jgi:hypothetical protein